MGTAIESRSLTSLLHEEAVPMATLHERYGPLLGLVRTLIGVVPNCDAYLEIWPPAFRAYNIMVPNFLNLPFSVFGFGGPPAATVGLGMYVASRTAGCPYCTAHTCSFAMRRGASTEAVARAFHDDAPLTAREKAAVAVARSLARFPSELIDAERKELEAQFDPREVEWVIAGISMMGFLNKFMDAIGVELEASTAGETVSTMGALWSGASAGRALGEVKPAAPPRRDSLWTKLRMIPNIPGALRLDGQWQRGVPDRWPAAGEALREKIGHDFPLLSRLKHRRVVRAIGAMLKHSLAPETSRLGLPAKILAGVIYATQAKNEELLGTLRAMAARAEVPPLELDEAAAFANSSGEASGDEMRRAIWLLARAASPSPAQINNLTISACERAKLPAASIIELISWISVLQMLHRFSSYYVAR